MKKEQIENFIKKWNVGFESKEQEKEFADEMRNELLALSQPTADLDASYKYEVPDNFGKNVKLFYKKRATDLDELQEIIESCIGHSDLNVVPAGCGKLDEETTALAKDIIKCILPYLQSHEQGITLDELREEFKKWWILGNVTTETITDWFYSHLPRLQKPVESEWISVEDRLPDEDISYYCYTNVGGYCTCFYKNGNWRYQHNSRLIDTILSITHYRHQTPPIK
jgi:hypothetical protein